MKSMLGGVILLAAASVAAPATSLFQPIDPARAEAAAAPVRLTSPGSADRKEVPVLLSAVSGDALIGPARMFRRDAHLVLDFARQEDIPQTFFWMQGRYVEMEGASIGPGRYVFPQVPARIKFVLGQRISEFRIKPEFVTNEAAPEALAVALKKDAARAAAASNPRRQKNSPQDFAQKSK